jgi:hypothetical protein
MTADELMTASEVAAILRVTPDCLSKWRIAGLFDAEGAWLGEGPDWFRIGAVRIVYRKSAVEKYLADQEVLTRTA